MNERINESSSSGGADGADPVTEGIKSLIGVVLLSTSAHVCCAPMASYLIRNESRFQYSHVILHT